MNDNTHFDKIFWFLVGSVAFVFAYVWAITFYPIPRMNIRFADSALSFFLGTVVGGGAISFLTGRSVEGKKKDKGAPGTTTADISATITTSEVIKEEEQQSNNSDNQ